MSRRITTVTARPAWPRPLVAGACTTGAPRPNAASSAPEAPKPASTPASSPAAMPGEIAGPARSSDGQAHGERGLHGHRSRGRADPVRSSRRHRLARLAHARVDRPRRDVHAGPGEDAGGWRSAGLDLRAGGVAPAGGRGRRRAERPVGRWQHCRPGGGGRRRSRGARQQDAVRARLHLRLRRPPGSSPSTVGSPSTHSRPAASGCTSSSTSPVAARRSTGCGGSRWPRGGSRMARSSTSGTSTSR